MSSVKFHINGSIPVGDTDVFVFGSNLAGIHGAGAAKQALTSFGAIYGSGVGRMGRSFAIPTKDEDLRILPLERIRAYVKLFLAYVGNHPEEEFFLTAIGTGYAGYAHSEIAPVFYPTKPNVSYPGVWKPFLLQQQQQR